METLKNEYWVIYRCAYRHSDVSIAEKKEIQSIYDRDGREAIFNAVKKKKLIPAVAMLFKRLNIDSEYWSAFVDTYTKRNQQVINCLNEMYQLFNKNNINKIAVVENFGALLSSTQNIAMFGSGDIDEYAPPSEKEKIYRVLQNAGYDIKEVHAGNILVSSSIRRDDFPEGFYFGINWDVTNRVNLPSFTANGDFIGWDACRYYKETDIRLPSPEGLMYVCLMHIAVHGFCKAPDIRLYYDIANAAEQGVDWETLVDWAKRDGNSVKIAMATYLANKLLSVNIPSFVFEIGNQKQFQNLLKIVYDSEDNRLKDFPSAISRLLIDIYSDDKGVAHGMKGILFPNNRWIKARYGSVLLGHLKHVVRLVR